MNITFILIVIIILIIFLRKNIIDYMRPTNEQESYISNEEYIDDTQNIETDTESYRIKKHRDYFFTCKDLINQSSHFGDAVDNVNMMEKNNTYGIGNNISDIYDKLTNTNKYK